MVVDIGGGTTDIAVISFFGIVYSRSLRIAGNHMDEAIVNYLKGKYNLLIGERTAERIKIKIGSAYAGRAANHGDQRPGPHRGCAKDAYRGRQRDPRALSEWVSTIVRAIRVTLERTPPEISADIINRGIVLAGGGALRKTEQANPRGNRAAGTHRR